MTVVAAPHLAARNAAATVLVTAGSTLAHTWAGGALPGVPALLALAAAVHGGGALVLRRRVPVVLLAPIVLVAQAGLHGMFGVLGPAHAHGHAVVAATPDHLTRQMVLAHVVSTALTVLVWWLAQRAATLLVRLLDIAPAYVGGRRDAGLRMPATRVRPVALSGLVGAPRRGPPVRLG